jgi:CRP-like cAMP-binding protein
MHTPVRGICVAQPPRGRTGPSLVSGKEITDLLECSHTLNCADGQHIIVKGQDTRPAFVVLEGAAEVRIRGAAIARFEEGEMFGEFAMLLHTRRAADVYAAGERVRFLVLDDRTLQRLLSARAELAAKLLLNLSRSLAFDCWVRVRR